MHTIDLLLVNSHCFHFDTTSGMSLQQTPPSKSNLALREPISLFSCTGAALEGQGGYLAHGAI